MSPALPRHRGIAHRRDTVAACLVTIAALGTCLSGRAGLAVQSLEGLRFRERAIEASLRGRVLAVRLPYDNPGGATADGRLSVELVDLAEQVRFRHEAEARIAGAAHGVLSAAIQVGPTARSELDLLRLRFAFRAEAGSRSGIRALSEALHALDVRVLGQDRLIAGGKGSLRVIAADRISHRPLAGAKVALKLATAGGGERVETSGRTDRLGSLSLDFAVPRAMVGTAQLRVAVESGDGQEEIARQVQVTDEAKILLTTDKPLYQPGQTIHLRALALRRPDLSPEANTRLTFEVEDGKGNLVFRQRGKTDRFGIAAARFVLASEVNRGDYRVRAILEKGSDPAAGAATGAGAGAAGGPARRQQQERTVRVDRYVLPKFKLVVTPERAFYRPGETVTGKLQADYLFGKPVAGGRVKIECSTFDVGRSKIAELSGRTDDSGSYRFEVKLPDHFVGTPFQQGSAFAELAVEVIDTADHKQVRAARVTVARDPIQVAAIAETGGLRQDLPNRVFLVASYADGSPVMASLKVRAELTDGKGALAQTVEKELATDSSGVADLWLSPRGGPARLRIEAADSRGSRGTSERTLSAAGGEEALIARPERSLYRVGERLGIELLSTRQKGAAYVDVVRDGQTVGTYDAEIAGGRARVEIDLGAGDEGTLRLSAYMLTPRGEMIRDTRTVIVSSAADLHIEVKPQKSVYRPGDQARIDFTVSDESQHPVLAALGIQIVDEAVFALSEMRPGLEKIYFRLEKELLTPRIEVHGFSAEEVVLPEAAAGRRERAAQVLGAAAAEQVTYALDHDSEKLAEATRRGRIAAAVMGPLYQKVQKIAGALRQYHKASKRFPPAKDSREILGALFAAGLLLRGDTTDPWGEALVVEPQSYGQGYFAFRSKGPDELLGTADDIQLGTQYAGEARRRGGWFGLLGGGGGRMARRMAIDDAEMAAPMEALAGAEPPMAPMAAPMVADRMAKQERAPASEARASGADGSSGKGQQQEPRLRTFFPESLYVNPALITDENGRAELRLATVADSITTWRITAIASSLAGQLGSTSAALRVFQDFFADIDLPVALTQNDEVSIPVAVYNYLPRQQHVQLRLERGPWFELVGGGNYEQGVDLGPGQVKAVYFRVRALRVGDGKLTVKAYGERLSDALTRSVEVEPDGIEKRASFSERLEGEVSHRIEFPEDAIDGASRLLVKVFPGVMGQVVDGLEQMLRMPGGCFEQTSSSTYPNVLILDYLRGNKRATPEVKMRAESYINAGYQRLLSFEVQGGGFSWFGSAPANKILTAYGLQEFFDMARVHEVDPRVIQRTQQWLANQQKPDGSFAPDTQFINEGATNRYNTDVVRITAYIAWSLARTGYHGAALERAVSYVRQHLGEAKDAYSLAVIANLLVNSGAKGADVDRVFDKLASLAKEDGKLLSYPSAGETPTYGRGDSADVETTALVARAMLAGRRDAARVRKILDYLTSKKDTFGSWYSTQATIQALQAFVSASGAAAGDADGQLDILVDGKSVERLRLTKEDADVMRLVDLTRLATSGQHQVGLRFRGTGSTMYQIIGRHYLPRPGCQDGAKCNGAGGQARPALEIDVTYDKRKLATDDTVTATLRLFNHSGRSAEMPIVDLGVPPGFELMSEDLTKLVAMKTIERFQTTGRQAILYFSRLDAGKPLELSYRLRAKYPLRVQAPAATIYEYYNPKNRSSTQPVLLAVEAR